MNNKDIKTRLEELLETMNEMVQEAKDISYESQITGGPIHGQMDAYFIPWMEQTQHLAACRAKQAQRRKA